CRLTQIGNQIIDQFYRLSPASAYFSEGSALMDPAFASDRSPKPRQLFCHLLVECDDSIESVGNLASRPDPIERQAHGKLTSLQSVQRIEQSLGFGGRLTKFGQFFCFPFTCDNNLSERIGSLPPH